MRSSTIARLAQGVGALLVASSLAIAAAAAAASTAGAVQCRLPGTHYAGKTSKGQKLCFTLSQDAKTVRELSFGFRYGTGCTGLPASGTFAATKPLKVGSDGSFNLKVGASRTVKATYQGTFTITARPASDTSFGTAELAGKVNGQKASGTVRLKLQMGEFTDTKTGKRSIISGDTGVLRWSAAR